MSSWLDRLDRRFGRRLPDNLTLGLVGLQGLCWFIEQFSPGFSGLLTLDAAKVMHGQVWRLLTFVVLPPAAGPIWFFLALAWTYTIGGTLEREWGGVRYLAYWLVGMLGTAALAFGVGVPGTNRYLLASLLLAVATLEPEREVMMLVIPIRLKWLALVEVLVLTWEVATLPDARWVFLLVALSNYVVFFGPGLWRALRARQRKAVQVVDAHRQAQTPTVTSQRRCATCGVTDDDRSVEFRVCTCERCGRPTNFCLPHVREHLAANAAADAP
jgi:hypothetical protein